jgi:predicted metal-dependent hydrolase
VPDAYNLGIEHIRAGRYFEAHEELELVWRAAPPEERDFYQGLVHVAVAWYQHGRGRPVATRRQLEKALRRLEPYEPGHRGVDVAALRAQLASLVESGDLGGREPDGLEDAVQGDVEPPVAVEEEQEPERDEDDAADDLDDPEAVA